MEDRGTDCTRRGEPAVASRMQSNTRLKPTIERGYIESSAHPIARSPLRCWMKLRHGELRRLGRPPQSVFDSNVGCACMKRCVGLNRRGIGETFKKGVSYMLTAPERRRLESEAAIREGPRVEPKSRGIIAAINSPFAIWTFSALALSIGGALFDGVRTCRTDANQSKVMYEKLETETFNRLDHFYKAILDAQTLKAFLDSPAFKERQEGHTFAEFKGRRLEEIKDEFLRFSSEKIGQEPLVYPWPRMQDEPYFGLLGSWEERVFPWYPLDTSDFTQATDGDLPRMKKMAQLDRDALLRARSERGQTVQIPLCGILPVAQRLITGTPSNVLVTRRVLRPKWAPIPPRRASGRS
jgi:hypothetical protein